MRLTRLRGGKIKPLFVRLVLVGVDQKRGSLDVARAVEHEYGAIAVPLGLDDFQAEFAPAFLPPSVAQDHGQACGEIAETLLAFAGFGRDLEPGFLGTVGGVTGRRLDRPGRNGKTDPRTRQVSGWGREARIAVSSCRWPSAERAKREIDGRVRAATGPCRLLHLRRNLFADDSTIPAQRMKARPAPANPVRGAQLAAVRRAARTGPPQKL